LTSIAVGSQLATSTLDHILTLQLAVAWAGEGGAEEPRLGWWRTDLVKEYGFLDLARELLPRTGRWAAFQALREAARRVDAQARARAHDPDALRTLFRLGFEVDERVDDRLAELKGRSQDPGRALPRLGELVDAGWDRRALEDWLGALPAGEWVTEPTGRRLRGDAPASVELLAGKLARGLLPLSDRYPVPHDRVAP
jgi:hypothetical protein